MLRWFGARIIVVMTLSFASRRSRLALAAVLSAAAFGVVLAARAEPTLEEQARRLHAVEPYGLEGLPLESWTRDGLVLRAELGGEGRARFELRLWPTENEAEDWFRERFDELIRREVAETDVVEGREPCAREGMETVCVGFDGNRTFESRTTTDVTEARMLVRIARKHWYRVMGGHSSE